MTTLFVPTMYQTVLTPVTELVTTGCTLSTIDGKFSTPLFRLGERHIEVEARLGRVHKDSGRFEAGVTPALFDSVCAKLATFPKWSFESKEWETVHDYTYHLDEYTIRTRKVFSTTEAVPVEHVIKKRVQNCDVYCLGPTPPLFNTLDIRTSLSTEQHVVLPEDFVAVHPVVVKKQQKRFIYKHWMFVVSKAVRDGVQVLEVELEILDLQPGVGSLEMQQYFALGLLMKLVDFYPSFNGPFMLMPVQQVGVTPK